MCITYDEVLVEASFEELVQDEELAMVLMEPLTADEELAYAASYNDGINEEVELCILF